MNILIVSELLPMVMVVAVGTGIYILLRTRWKDEPKKKDERSDDR